MEVEKTQNEERSLNFIEQIVEKDLAEGVNNGRVQTRFPPEPNGYLHIGHVKAICMDFGIAEKYNGVCNLRFDDTNPAKEDTEYVETIERDIRWLGFKWGQIFYASDYFQQLYDLAIMFIKQGKAYVDEQTAEQIHTIQEVYRIIYNSGLNTTQALAKVEAEMPASPERDMIVNFVKASPRGIIKG